MILTTTSITHGHVIICEYTLIVTIIAVHAK